MSTNYMLRSQHDRHQEQIRILEDKISEARMKVGEAAKLGDLSENAEYDAAREEVELLTTRYQELTSALVGMQIVDPKRTAPDMITIGKRVTLRDPDGKTVTYNVVGGGWVDASRSEVSYLAPLAAGLIGHKEGESVEVQVPDGARTYEVISIEPYE